MVGGIYFAVSAAVALAAVVGCIAAAFVTGSWTYLVVLALPAVWLWMWRRA